MVAEKAEGAKMKRDRNITKRGKDARKRAKLTVVSVSDGAVLYVDGRLVCNWFTIGHANILRALGFKKWTERQASECHYRHNDFPKLLKDCKLTQLV